MSVALDYPHVQKTGDGPAHLLRIPRVRVAQIVMDYLAHGWSPDEMCRHHPYLTPAEAHAAMGYYFDHQAEIEQEIRSAQSSQSGYCSGALPWLSRMRGALSLGSGGSIRSSLTVNCQLSPKS